jgi:adenosine deaminase
MTPEFPEGLETFVQALPKTETHLHIEGALPYDELLRTLEPATYGPDPEFRRKSHRYPSFPDFEQTLLAHALPWFTTPERYHEAARVIFAGHVRQNVRYVETSFHLHVTEFIKVPGPVIIDAILSAAPPGLEVRVFAGMLRNAYEGPLRATIDSLHTWENLSGVDLHGFEGMPTEAWSAHVWRRAAAAGKVTKCHAGEFGGPERVREAIEMLGVRRIQHGVRSVEDPAVVERLARQNVTLEVCPASNVSLGVAPSARAVPVRTLYEAGVPVALGADDPLLFGPRLVSQYEIARDVHGFTDPELAALARMSIQGSAAPASVQGRLLAGVDHWLAA